MNFKDLFNITYMENIENYEIYLYDDGGYPVVTNSMSIVPRMVSKEVYERFKSNYPDDNVMPTLSQFQTLIAKIENEKKA